MRGMNAAPPPGLAALPDVARAPLAAGGRAEAGAAWRWLLDRDDGPWYPTVQPFRQGPPGDRAGGPARVRAAPAGWLRQRAA